MPPIATSYSASNYEIVSTTDIIALAETITASNSDEVSKITDGDFLEDYSDSTSDCFIEISYKTSFVGVLDSIKFFINNLNDNTPFVDNLVLQGYDGASYTDLWTIDANIHEGWNSYEWEEGSKPSYNAYRF